jgi:hypothetical protein
MMNAIIDPISVEPVEMTLLIEEYRSASMATTLYDLIAAIQDVAGADDTLVVATVRHILGSGRAIWHGAAAQCPSCS